MARIRLRERDTRAKNLPEVCMVCGESSHSSISKNFSWFPPWVGVTILLGLLPYVILAAVLTKKMSVQVPVCQRHGGYFWKRTALIWLTLLAWLGISGLALVISIALSDNRRGGGGDPIIMLSCVTFIIGLIIAIIVIGIVQNTTIRPKEITDHDITLVSVHDGFVDAFESFRDERRGTSRRDDDDDDFDPPPRRRPARDDDPRARDKFRERPDDDEPRPRRRREEDYED